MLSTESILESVGAADRPSFWSATGRNKFTDVNVATDGDGYVYAWVVDIQAKVKVGWIPFEGEPLLLGTLRLALEHLADRHDYRADIDRYEWQAAAPINLPDFPCSSESPSDVVRTSPTPPPATDPRLSSSRVEGPPWVYILESAGSYKIGMTTKLSPDSRIAELQTGNPQRIRLVHQLAGGAEIEQLLHRTFAQGVSVSGLTSSRNLIVFRAIGRAYWAWNPSGSLRLRRCLTAPLMPNSRTTAGWVPPSRTAGFFASAGKS